MITFETKTNPYIDELVKLSWESNGIHKGEYFLLRNMATEDIVKLHKDEKYLDKSTNNLKVPLDLSKFKEPNYSKEYKSQKSFQSFIIAVDTGSINLGEFIGGGFAFAIRGAAVCIIEGKIHVLIYNTDALLVDDKNLGVLLKYIGKRLGEKNLYFSKNQDGEYTVRNSIKGQKGNIQDKFRSFVERMIQEEAVSILRENKKGLLLIDGSLSIDTHTTPAEYLQDMLYECAEYGINVLALSKQTTLTIAGKPLNSLFDKNPKFIGYLPIKKILQQEREKQAGSERQFEDLTAANEMYAVRFGLGPPSLTFRADVHNSMRSIPSEVLEEAMNMCIIYGSYPKPLIDAHQFSCFMFQDIQSLTSDLIVRTGAQPKENQSMEWMFQPFGAFGK